MEFSLSPSLRGEEESSFMSQHSSSSASDRVRKGQGAQEYDPSEPLDSSDEEDHGTLNFVKERSPEPVSEAPEVATVVPAKVQPKSAPAAPPVTSSKITIALKDSDIDLNSIPLPTEEYKRPTIQFSIPTRHRLMSISSLIKRQKGVARKQEKVVGNTAANFSTEISKAYSDPVDKVLTASDSPSEDDRGKVSLVEEIFGSDEEENGKNDADEATVSSQSPPESDLPESLSSMDAEGVGQNVPLFPDDRWKTISVLEPEGNAQNNQRSDSTEENSDKMKSPQEAADGGSEEVLISIKPQSELMEPAHAEESSPELVTVEPSENENVMETENVDKSQALGKENKPIILECISDDDEEGDSDFEVTFVGMGKTSLADVRQARLRRRKRVASSRKSSHSPLNGFEEGEIIDHSDKKRKKGKKKKSKKRKRSKDSKVHSDRSNSPEKKSASGSDSKEVSWRKPRSAKSRNYRNGKRDSEDRLSGERVSRHSSVPRKRSSSGRSRSRRHRSVSGERHRRRSISRSVSPRRWRKGSRSKRSKRSGSFRSNSSSEYHSSPSPVRSRSLTKRRGRHRYSPSPIRKRRRSFSRSPRRLSNPRRTSRSPRKFSSPRRLSPRRLSKSPRRGISRSPRKISRSPRRLSKSPRKGSRSPHRISKSPRVKKKSKGFANDSKTDKIRAKSKSPQERDKHKVSKKEDGLLDELKDKRKKKDDVEREKKKKRKKREKSLSPVKAIVADGDSIVVSLNFQKPKEDVSKPSKPSVAKDNDTHKNADTEIEDNKQSLTSNSKLSPHKGTILINLSASPNAEQVRKSVDRVDQEEATSEDQLRPESNISQRNDGLDCVSSSHENFSANTPESNAIENETSSSSPDRGVNSSKSPFKFNDYLVSSTCDVTKTSNPINENDTTVAAEAAIQDQTDMATSLKSSSVLPEETRASVIPETPVERVKSPAPVPSLSSISPAKPSTPAKSASTSVGSIPGLFSPFPSGVGGIPPTSSIIIPAPPRITPSSNSSSLLAPNVLVSVASALYAPLLAAKHPPISSTVGGAGGGSIRGGPATNKHVNSSQGNFASSHGNRFNGAGEQDGDSPFSPNSSDGDDLFEPPIDSNNCVDTAQKKVAGSDSVSRHQLPASGAMHGKPDTDKLDKKSLFDTLFSTPSKPSTLPFKQSSAKKKSNNNLNKRLKSKKGTPMKRGDADKNGEELSSRLEDVPNSAVSLRINEKYLKKLNRQERVVEEVKLVLKPHYSKKHISKDEYKDILRKAVPKICHNKSGEINPHKIKELVEAYVKKFRRSRKSDTKL